MSLILICAPPPIHTHAHMQQQGTRRGMGTIPTQLWPLSLLPRGERYIGMWQADQRHGPGVMVTQAGVCYQGNFQADKMVVSGVTRTCPELPCPCTRVGLWSPPSRDSEAELRPARGG